MSYFTQDFLDFFKDLAKNNNRDWFQANKKRYERSVKEPFAVFIQKMIDLMHADDPSVNIETKDAIFRINRDVRFSQDKSPYKLNASAIVSPGGKKDKSIPGLYIQLDAEHVRIYSGAHMLEKDALQRVREKIAGNLKEFDKLVNDKKFKNTWGDIHGEQNKKLPKELQAAADQQPLLYNKGWYYFIKWDPETILDKKLPEKIMKAYAVAQPLNTFLGEAIMSHA